MVLKMNKKFLTSVFTLLLANGLNMTAFAQDTAVITGDIKKSNAKTTIIAKAPADLNFKSLDVDRDGKITLHEAIKDIALANKFNITDVNHDGVITVDEYAMYASNLKHASPTVH